MSIYLKPDKPIEGAHSGSKAKLVNRLAEIEREIAPLAAAVIGESPGVYSEAHKKLDELMCEQMDIPLGRSIKDTSDIELLTSETDSVDDSCEPPFVCSPDDGECGPNTYCSPGDCYPSCNPTSGYAVSGQSEAQVKPVNFDNDTKIS